MKSAHLLPKAIKGSIQLQWKRCGRKNCRCSEGYLHGPYIVRLLACRWQAKTALCATSGAAETLTALDQAKAKQSSIRTLRLELREIQHASL